MLDVKIQASIQDSIWAFDKTKLVSFQHQDQIKTYRFKTTTWNLTIVTMDTDWSQELQRWEINRLIFFKFDSFV